MRLKPLLISISLMLTLPSVCLSDPAVTGISEQRTHGQSLVITGTDFGSKFSAKPLMWEDCETPSENDWPISAANSSSRVGFVVYEPGDTSSGEDVPSTHEIKYRAAPWTTSTTDSIPAPHSNSTKFLGGGHWDNGTAHCYGVSVTIAPESGYKKDWYASWYHRLDSNWPSCGAQPNNKIVSFQESSTAPFTGDYFYFDHMSPYPCGSGEVEINPSRYNPVFQYAEGVSIPDTTAPWAYTFSSQPSHTDPVGNWIKVEIVVSETQGFVYVYFDNEMMYGASGNTDFFTGGDENDFGYDGIGSMTLGDAYYRVTTGLTSNDANAAIDDIYVDDSLSRVMIGDASTYSACTILEPQPPTTWSAASITVTVNEGALGSVIGDYLYVIDSDGTISDQDTETGGYQGYLIESTPTAHRGASGSAGQY